MCVVHFFIKAFGLLSKLSVFETCVALRVVLLLGVPREGSFGLRTYVFSREQQDDPEARFVALKVVRVVFGMVTPSDESQSFLFATRHYREPVRLQVVNAHMRLTPTAFDSPRRAVNVRSVVSPEGIIVTCGLGLRRSRAFVP